MREDRLLWDRRYVKGVDGLDGPPVAYLISWLPFLPRGRTLDLAAGCGRHSLMEPWQAHHCSGNERETWRKRGTITDGSDKARQDCQELAEKKDAAYHSDKGIDIRTSTQAIEVEVDADQFKDGVRQLRGTNKARYLAVPSKLVNEAIDYTSGSGVGVMNEHGKIKKRAR